MSYHESRTGDGKDSSPDTERVVTRIDIPKYGETLKFMYKVPTDLNSLTKGLPSLIMV